MSTTPLALGRYADVIAILHHFHEEPWSDVLAALAIDEAQWRTTDAHWTEELALCYSRRQESVAYEMATRYAKMRRRLARHGLGLEAAIAKLAAVSGGAAAAGERAGAEGRAEEAGANGGSGAQPATAVPSYLREGASGPPGAAMGPLRMERASPGAVAPPASVGVAPPASVGVAPPANVGVAPPASVGVAPPANVGVVPPASVGVAPPASVPVAGGRPAGTMAFDGPLPVPLPFREGASPLAVPPPAGEGRAAKGGEGAGAADAGKQGASRPASSLSGETVAPSDLAAVMKRVLPFAGAGAGAGAATPAPATPPVGAASTPPVAAPAGARPAAATPAPATPPVGAASTPPVAAPAGARGATGPGGLTVEQYASLCEDLALAGAQAPEVLRRYGLGAEEKAAVEEQWTALFQKQPSTLQAWETARKMYRAWRTKQAP